MLPASLPLNWNITFSRHRTQIETLALPGLEPAGFWTGTYAIGSLSLGLYTWTRTIASVLGYTAGSPAHHWQILGLVSTHSPVSQFFTINLFSIGSVSLENAEKTNNDTFLHKLS